MAPVLLFFSIAVYAATETTLQSSKTVLMVYRSGNWGVANQDRKAMQVLENGKVQCYYRAPKEESFVKKVYAELKPIPLNIVKLIQQKTMALRSKRLVDSPQVGRCADNIEQLYNSNEKDRPFLILAVEDECGFSRVESPSSYYLEGLADGLYFQCPEISSLVK